MFIYFEIVFKLSNTVSIFTGSFFVTFFGSYLKEVVTSSEIGKIPIVSVSFLQKRGCYSRVPNKRPRTFI